MITPSAPAFPAKGLVVPVTRPVVSILRIVKESARTTTESQRSVLGRELARQIEHLARTLERLARMARVGDDSLPPLIARVRSLAARGLDPRDPERLGRVMEEVVAFSKTHHETFRSIATKQKSLFLLDYWENVERKCVLLLHGDGSGDEAAKIAQSLLDGCYFHVEQHRLDLREPPLPHHLRALYATDPEELRRAVPAWQPDVVLCDVGSPRRGYDMRLGRQVTRLERSSVSVLFRPFSATRLLGCFEEARLRQLLEARVDAESRETVRTPA
jgi:CheY-like chemotaxis protein